MASYFIKYKIQSWTAKDIYYKKTMIIDFDKFEKVNSTSVENKIKEKIGGERREYEIEDIVKL